MIKMTEEQSSLVPQDEYLKVGLHIGTKFQNKGNDAHSYTKVRPDGIKCIECTKINERLELAGKLLSNYKPEEALVVWKENRMECSRNVLKVTGIRSFAGRYHPGVLTNTKLEDFIEVKLIFVTDPFPDKNLVKMLLR